MILPIVLTCQYFYTAHRRLRARRRRSNPPAGIPSVDREMPVLRHLLPGPYLGCSNPGRGGGLPTPATCPIAFSTSSRKKSFPLISAPPSSSNMLILHAFLAFWHRMWIRLRKPARTVRGRRPRESTHFQGRSDVEKRVEKAQLRAGMRVAGHEVRGVVRGRTCPSRGVVRGRTCPSV
jgi:hypothetical protein